MARIKDSDFLSNCIYTDINKAKQNLYIKLVLAINNFQTIAIAVNNGSQLMLAFNLQSNQITLND